WYTATYAGRAAEAPVAAERTDLAALATARPAGAVVASSRDAASLATSTPAPAGPAVGSTKPGDWFNTVASLPGLAVRGLAGPAPAPTQRAARAPPGGREPPSPIVVDGAVARATAIALLPTPDATLDAAAS